MTVVVKIGGARAVDPEGALADVASLIEDGEDVVLTHGGSTAVDETLEALGQEPTYVETPGGVVGRFTDEETMDVFKMVMPGKLNTDLVESLQNEGVDAVGLSGTDGKLLEGKRKSAVRVKEDGKKKIKRGDHSGTIESVNADLLETVLAGGYTPVVSVPVLGQEKDGEYTAVNADADRAAAAIAGRSRPTSSCSRTSRDLRGSRRRVDQDRLGRDACGVRGRRGGCRRLHDEEGHGRRGSPRERRGVGHRRDGERRRPDHERAAGEGTTLEPGVLDTETEVTQ